jgi:type II secretory ATPase GspE/PulE/Tfp pilus assembly ATPase PilB-like protein
MFTLGVIALLAQVPSGEIYIHPGKLVTICVMFTLWALYAQWADKDTVAVNTFRIIWNLVTIGCGFVALLLLLLLPNFWAAISAFAVINIALATVYVIHRNGLVEEDSKICTAAHLSRLMREGLSGKKKGRKLAEVKERVRITTPDKKVVQIPTEEAEREQFRLAQDLLFDSLWRHASVVEIVPAGQASRVSMSVDGVAAEREPMPRPEGDALVQFFKRIANLNLEERRKPQRGKLMVAIGDSRFDVVVRTDGSTAGEKLSLRVIGAEKSYKVADLGFTEKQLEVARQIIQTPKGLVVLSASPGNGLTTTAYSFTRSHDAFLQNIQTLEIEKELEVENVTQHVFIPVEGKTLASELQKIVRSDPDVVVIPEIREKAAAAVAAQAAVNKQKVYVAFPAGDVFEALRKWMAIVGDDALPAKGLLAVINQRLARLLCAACKQPYKPDPQMLRKLNMPADQVLYRVPEPQYDKHGNPILCQNCQGAGYSGRTGVYNILLIDDALREVIRGGGSAADLQAYAIKHGIQSLQQQALQKVFEGKTSIEEVVRVTRVEKPAAAPAALRPKAPATGAAPSAR